MSGAIRKNVWEAPLGCILVGSHEFVIRVFCVSADVKFSFNPICELSIDPSPPSDFLIFRDLFIFWSYYTQSTNFTSNSKFKSLNDSKRKKKRPEKKVGKNQKFRNFTFSRYFSHFPLFECLFVLQLSLLRQMHWKCLGTWSKTSFSVHSCFLEKKHLSGFLVRTNKFFFDFLLIIAVFQYYLQKFLQKSSKITKNSIKFQNKITRKLEDHPRSVRTPLR